MVRLQTLDLRIGVRVPASQPSPQLLWLPENWRLHIDEISAIPFRKLMGRRD